MKIIIIVISFCFELPFSELRKQLDNTSSELVAKQHIRDALRDFLHINQAENEIKVLQRKKNDLKIRIKNLEREMASGSGNGSRNLSRASNSSVTEFLEAVNGSDVTNGANGDAGLGYDEISLEYEYFNPEEMMKEKHVRPSPRYTPTNSLPHSKQRLRFPKRVGLLRDVSSKLRGLNIGLVGRCSCQKFSLMSYT